MHKFNRDGILENVPEERWQWLAIYSDDTSLRQFGTDEVFHQFKEIDQSKLREFRMFSGSRFFSLMFQPGMKLIHFYDYYVLNANILEPNKDTPKTKRFKNYVFGYEKGSEKCLFTIMEDDNLAISRENLIFTGEGVAI